MANLPDRKDGQRRVDHWDQSGHFNLARSGHLNLAVTSLLRSLGKCGRVLRDGCAIIPRFSQHKVPQTEILLYE
jgi:hypothetical protein